jgi:hypothetical protein
LWGELIMEAIINKRDFKNLSRQFRRVSGQLLNCGDSTEAIRLTKRFIEFIDKEPLLSDFIKKNHTEKFDMENIIKSTNINEKYEIPIEINREITFIYQLLKYTAENFDDYIVICRGYAFYRGATYRDCINNFNHQVVNLLVNHITDYLEGISIEMGLDEKENAKILVQGSVGQLNFSEQNLEAHQTNNQQSYTELISLISELIRELKNEQISDTETQEDAIDFLEDAKSELQNETPKKSVFRRVTDTLSHIRKSVDDSVHIAQLIDKAIVGFSQLPF